MRWRNLSLFVLVALAALAWADFIVRRFSPEPAWADASGYFNSASLLSKGEFSAKLRVPAPLKDYYPYDVEPVGFHFDSTRSVLVPTYFVGLPLVLAAVHAFLSWNLASYAAVLGSAVCLLACTYAVLRSIRIDRPLAAAAVVGLAWCPVFVFSSSQTYSDTVASAACALSALCVVRDSRRGLLLAFIAGASLGFAVLVRSTSCLLLPALLIFAPSWKRRLAVGAGCLPFVAVLMAYQHLAYGEATSSGYGAISRLFEWHYVPSSLANYAFLLPAVLPICVMAPVGALWAGPSWSARLRMGFSVWAASFGAFYAFYSFTGHDWTSLRFIEPAFPALLALGCIGLEALAARLEGSFPRLKARSIAALVLLAAAGCVGFFGHFADPKVHDRGFVAARAWTRENLPGGALVVCESFSGSIYFDTPNAVLRWDITQKENIQKYLRVMWDAGQPVYSLVDEAELSNPELLRKVPGRWLKMADFGTASAWRIERP